MRGYKCDIDILWIENSKFLMPCFVAEVVGLLTNRCRHDGLHL